MPKILIIGSKGMAGHVILHYLKENTVFEVVDIARDDRYWNPSYKLDVTSFDQLEFIIKKEKPGVVINCIGILNKDAEMQPGYAILLNSYLPHFIAKLGTEEGFKLIHISTDCVFNGKKGNYTEDAPKDGTGFYAQSKALGEVTYNDHLTLRTSIVGPELKENGIGLFGWFMKQTGEVQGYSNAIWTGVTTVELAKAIVAAIEQNAAGVQHLVNHTSISKYELLLLFREVFEKDIHILSIDSYRVDKSLLRTNRDFNYIVPSYKQMMQEMKTWMDTHPTIYKNICPVL